MRRCKITIEFDREDPTYTMTEPVTGQVIVDVRRATRCDELELSCLLKTHGRGDRYKKEYEEIHLFSGDWQPGEYAYPFRIPIKSNQASYHGEYINVDWYLKAEADIPKSLDVSKEIDFLRMPESGSSSSEESFANSDYEIAKAQVNKKSLASIFGAIAIFLIFLLPMGLALFSGVKPDYLPKFLQPLADYLASNEIIASDLFARVFDNFEWLFFTVVFSVFAYAGLKFWRQNKTNKILGKPKVTFESGNQAHPGDRIRGLLSFTPTRNASVRYFDAVLKCYERTTDTSGTSSSTYEHVHYEQPINMPFLSSVTNNLPVENEFEFQIPAGVPTSFKLGKNLLIWEVEMDMQIGRWLSWKSKTPIKVVSNDSNR